MSNQEPTSSNNIKLINNMFDKCDDILYKLYNRWLDEKEYEDINDYKAVIEKYIPAEITITKMTKKPFGFQFNVGTTANYRMSTTAKSSSWARI